MAEVADQTATETPEFWDVLKKRAGRRPGRLYKLGAGAFLDSMPSQTTVDKSAMSATFCISRPIPDREDDVIMPEGVIFDAYRLNPVVFWDHGFTNLTLPIGTSEAPDGNLAISVSPEAIDATCFFSQTLPEAEQIFQLVDEGIIRAASIHVDPIDAVVRVRNGAADRPGLLVHTSSMLEWSLCGVGCNPEAVRKTLSAGKLAGKPIVESLVKALRPHASPAPVISTGWTPQPVLEPEPMAKSLTKDNEPDGDEMAKRIKSFEDSDEVKRLRKEYGESAGDDEAMKSKRKGLREKMKSIAKDMGLSENDTQIPDEPGEPVTKDEPADELDDVDTPLGSQILKAAYASLSELADQLDQSSKPLENPEVKDYMGTMGDALRGHLAEMDELHKSQYPEHPELSKDDGGDEGAPTEDSEPKSLQKFLARSKTHRMSVKGIAHELLKFCNSRQIQMPKQYREKLGQMSRRLSGISKSAETAAPTAAADDESRELARLKAELGEIKQIITDAIPHRR